MDSVITVEDWTIEYETVLEEKGLLEWIISLDDEAAEEDRRAVAGETRPNDTAGQIQWKKDWIVVKNCVERALGDTQEAVYRHEEYERIRSDPSCRTLKRIQVIQIILKDLASEIGPAPYSFSIPKKSSPPSSFADTPPSKRPRFTSSPSPSISNRTCQPIRPKPNPGTPTPGSKFTSSSSTTKRGLEHTSIREAVRDTDASPSATADNSADLYASICECGVASESRFVAGGSVVMKEYLISKGGKHRSLVEGRGEGVNCLTGIPQDPSLVQDKSRVIFAGKQKRHPLNSEIRDRVTAARIKFASSQAD